MPKMSSIGFTVVKKTACLPPLRLVPHGIDTFLIIEFNSFAFPTWKMYSVNPFGNSTLSRNAGSTAIPRECPWIALKYEMSLDSRNIETFFLFLLLWPVLIFNLQATIAKRRRTSASCTLR